MRLILMGWMLPIFTSILFWIFRFDTFYGTCLIALAFYGLRT